MLVLLPPSETKAHPPTRGAPLDLDTLSFPSLTPQRERVLDALVRLANGPRARAMSVLGLAPGLSDEVDRDAALREAPTVRAGALYTGVLYDALDLASLPGSARRRATTQLVVVSALFGALRLSDRVPAYRLSAGTTLPRIGPLGGAWREPLGEALPEAAGRGLVLDLRSSAYAALWRPSGELAERTVTVRVLHERVRGDRTSRAVVSHFNKATKGRLVRALLESADRPRDADELADLWTGQDRVVELAPAQVGRPRVMDVVVSQV